MEKEEQVVLDKDSIKMMKALTLIEPRVLMMTIVKLCDAILYEGKASTNAERNRCLKHAIECVRVVAEEFKKVEQVMREAGAPKEVLDAVRASAQEVAAKGFVVFPGNDTVN